MKNLFHHTKRPERDYREELADDYDYDWDDEDDYGEETAEDASYEEDYEDELVYEDTEAVESGEYYEEAEDAAAYAEGGDGEYYEDDAFFQGEITYEEPAYEAAPYAEDGYANDGAETYADDGDGYAADDYSGEGCSAESGYADDGTQGYADDDYGYENDEPYYEDAEEEAYYEEDAEHLSYDDAEEDDEDEDRGGFLGRLREMSMMDRIIGITGVAVLALAIVTGVVYFGARTVSSQINDFANVGKELDGIELIGESGLLAVADATKARIEAAAVEEGIEDDTTSYEEKDYASGATVNVVYTSVLKDLKIKFSNSDTERLISNVPFSVTVKTPGGSTETWTDDDRDGIIYKSGIAAGTYTVTMNELDAKYAGYVLPTGTKTINVVKEIAYKKIDVKNEIKSESEVNTAKEDTEIKDTTVESTLTDTVEWVASTQTPNTYTEVAKTEITDPATVASTLRFMRVSLAITGTESNDPANTTIPTETTTAEPAETATPAAEATATPTAEVTVTPTPEATATPTASPTASPTVAPTIALSANPAAVSVNVGGKVDTQISATGVSAVNYIVVTKDASIATGAIDSAGKLTVTGVRAGETTITVSATSATNTAITNAIDIPVKVGTPTITLDKTTATVYTNATQTLVATVSGSGTLTAVSTDTTIATVAVSDKTITITGVKAGSVTVTVIYTENGVETKATCAVTVKLNPKEDKTTLLKDKSGNQIYVTENGEYREATYADYYTATNFYIKGTMKYTGWNTIDGKVYFFKADGNYVTGEQVIQGAKYNFASDGSLVTGSGTMGIDVSKWNGSIDWTAVKNSGISYVIIRVGYRGSSAGALIDDSKFASNIKGATNAGLKVGVYFFTQAVNEVEAVEEASMVLERIKGYKISYPVFLDVEKSGGRADSLDKATRTAVIKAFCQTIQNAGYTAGIYANKTWFTEKISTGELSAYKIWLAQYAATPTYSGRYDLWQYKSTGKVSGISGNVDLNLSYLGY